MHAGHIAFALQAITAARLDQLYFLPERHSRRKKGVEHFGHRVAMLHRAILPHPKFDVLELHDISLSVQRTLPKLQTLFAGSTLVFLVGSDTVPHMADWPYIDRLFAEAEIVVGMRQDQTVKDTKQTIASWPQAPTVTLINSHAPDVSSSEVRQALQTRQPAKGLLKSVSRYSNHHWLYVSVT